MIEKGEATRKGDYIWINITGGLYWISDISGLSQNQQVDVYSYTGEPVGYARDDKKTLRASVDDQIYESQSSLLTSSHELLFGVQL